MTQVKRESLDATHQRSKYSGNELKYVKDFLKNVDLRR